MNQEKYAEAEPLYLRALAIDQEALGSDHSSVAFDLENIAHLYREQKRDAEAEPLEARAKAIREKKRRRRMAESKSKLRLKARPQTRQLSSLDPSNFGA